MMTYGPLPILTAPEADRSQPGPLLEVSEVSAGYGKAQVVFGASVTVGPGEVVALLGANGAGKTTFLRALSGLVRARTGSVHLGGREITNAAPEDILRAGMAHVPQGRGLFSSLSVEENVRVGAYTLGRRRREQNVRELFATMFPQLEQRREQAAGHLSGGEQQMVALMRGLVTRPRLLLLDEPSLGLSPALRNEVLRTITSSGESGTGVLVVEQNARHVLGVSDRCYVMRSGRIVFEGPARAALESFEDLSNEYLGAGPTHGA
jgi:branched-chain amino acid transport system ATP-binding protein